MTKTCCAAFLTLLGASCAFSQGRPIDWPFYAGDAQRSGWEKSDSRITKDNVKDFVLVLKRKLENKGKGARTLTPPVVIGNLISYRGFKELAFVAGTSNMIWSIDADLDRVFWQKQLESVALPKPGGASPLCSGSVVATPSLTPPTNFGAGRGQRPAPAPVAPANPAKSLLTAGGGAGGFGSPRPAFVLSDEGKLHLLNTSNGSELVAAVPFIPPGAKASSLTIADGIIYTTTSGGCGGAPDGVWAMDLRDSDAISKFATGASNISPLGGLAIASDGAVFVQTGEGAFDAAAGKWGNSLLALSPRDLKLQSYFQNEPATGTAKKDAANSLSATPVIFTYKERVMVASAGRDGRLSLLEAKNIGGDDHKTAPYQTPPITAPGGGVWGGLSTWEDSDGTRWILAPVWGPLNPELHLAAAGGVAKNGSIVAFKLQERQGKPILTAAWVSRDMNSPEPPVITSGVIFVLSAGEFGRDERPKGSSHATLYALDGTTGKEIYSTGTQVTAPANLTGMTIANSRVYFTTTDNTLYAFGIFLER